MTRQKRQCSIKYQMLRKCSYIIIFFIKIEGKQPVIWFECCFLKCVFTGLWCFFSWNFQDFASGLSIAFTFQKSSICIQLPLVFNLREPLFFPFLTVKLHDLSYYRFRGGFCSVWWCDDARRLPGQGLIHASLRSTSLTSSKRNIARIN